MKIAVPIGRIAQDSGYCYVARTGRYFLSSHKRPSTAVVLEDGKLLPGPANSSHQEIRALGAGRYSFWHKSIYFSATDNSDPRKNGRRYEFSYSAELEAVRKHDQIEPLVNRLWDVAYLGFFLRVLLFRRRPGMAPAKDPSGRPGEQ